MTAQEFTVLINMCYFVLGVCGVLLVRLAVDACRHCPNCGSVRKKFAWDFRFVYECVECGTAYN